MSDPRPAPLASRLNALVALGDRLDRAAPERLADEALAAVVPELELRAGWVFLSGPVHGDARHDRLSYAAGHGLPPALAADDDCALRDGGCECQARYRRGRLERGINVVTCSRLASASGDRGGLERHASVPVRGSRGTIGILNLAAAGDRTFASDELAFLEVVGRQLGAAVQRARLADAADRASRAQAAAEERARLTGEMHDALSQLLFAADLQLRLASDGDREAPRRAERLLADARAELRTLIASRRSPDLNDGLVAALHRLSARMAPEVQVHLEDRTEGALEHERVPPASAERDLALLRAAQEAVHNAVRHGKATRVRIVLAATPDGGVRLEVSDDGRGCDPEVARTGPGLEGVAERLARLGGRFAVARSGLGGLRVEAALPAGRAERGPS